MAHLSMDNSVYVSCPSIIAFSGNFISMIDWLYFDLVDLIQNAFLRSQVVNKVEGVVNLKPRWLASHGARIMLIRRRIFHYSIREYILFLNLQHQPE